MKKLWVCMIVVLIGIAPGIKAQDPITLIIKQAIKKVIIAVDLKIQRLQTKTIWLQNAQKVAENTMSKLKLDQITDWVQKQKDLYQNYFTELWEVKDVLSNYHRIKEITQQEIALVKEYHQAWNGVQQDGHFTPEEVLYIGQAYIQQHYIDFMTNYKFQKGCAVVKKTYNIQLIISFKKCLQPLCNQGMIIYKCNLYPVILYSH